MTVRLCKTALVATVALLMTLAAFNNIADYGSNWLFVRHVMAMDTIFPGSDQHWRAIPDQAVQHVAYLAIIAAETTSALLLIGASLALARQVRDPARFDRAIPLAAAGLTLVMLIYGAGFLAVGGEWFLMWQSHAWGGSEGAARFFLVAAAVLLVLLSGRRETD